jgi:N-acetylglucosaminyl-diphospho-decaprenol L-rhamnosyltransferase
MIAVSIVSHGHGEMVGQLVARLRANRHVSQIIVTRNIAEDFHLESGDRVTVIENENAKGFGANHNAAFVHCIEPFFCVLNPDIQLNADPFSALLRGVGTESVGVVAPMVMAPDGLVEDSARRFPTFGSLLLKAVGLSDGSYKLEGHEPVKVDWVAGMCMLFRAEVFRNLKGFDERYFLYYEDVDICARLWSMGLAVFVCPEASVVHDARRASRSNLRHMRWHLRSMLRFLISNAGRRCRS